MANERSKKRPTPVSSERFAAHDTTANLGPLADLAGTWTGHGFNLIARPDFHDKADLYLQLNHTHDYIKFDPIGSPVPNRGFGQDDIGLYGLTYLNQIQDATVGSGLHIEPPNVPPAGAQLVARMATIPHGNAA